MAGQKKKDGEEGGDDQSETFTRAQAEELFGEMFAKGFNSAWTAKMKDFDKKQDQRFADLVTQLKPPEKTEEEKAAEDEAKKKAAGGEPAPWEKELARERKAREKMEADLKTEREARAAEQKQREIEEDRADLASHLRKSGLDEVRTRAAVALLHGEEKRLVREGGKRFLRLQGKHGDEDLPLEAGVAAWLKTDDGKAFVPAAKVGGSGNNPNRQGEHGQKSGKMTDAEFGTEILKAVTGQG